MFRKHDLPQPGRVVVAEPISPVIATASELGLGGDAFEFAGVGFESEIASADGEGLAGGDGFHGAAAVAVGGMDPAVESGFESVEPMLLIAFGEPGEEHASDIGSSIGVGVFRVEQVGRSRHQDAPPPGHDAAGIRNAFEEDIGALISTGAVAVGEDLDHAAGLSFAVDAHRVVAHLHHPQTAIGVPVEGDGIHDDGFGGDEFDGETGGQGEGSEGFCGRTRGWHADIDPVPGGVGLRVAGGSDGDDAVGEAKGGADEGRGFAGFTGGCAVLDELGPTAGPAEMWLDALGPEMDGDAVGVGEDEVIEAIAVEVEEVEAVVATVGVQGADAFGQGEIGVLPDAGDGIAGLYDGAAGLMDETFGFAVAVEVAQGWIRNLGVVGWKQGEEGEEKDPGHERGSRDAGFSPG